MIVEVCELDDPREPSRRSRRNRDAAYVELVGLVSDVRQKLQGVQLNTGQAPALQLHVRDGTELEQVVEECGRPGVWRDSRRDPREMVDDRIAKAGALTFKCLTGNAVGDRGVHRRHSTFGCTLNWCR